MEEFIKYFYNINIEKKSEKDNRVILKSKYKKYQLINYEKDPNKLYKKYIVLKNNGICCHDIILNKNGNILSNYDSKNYLLLRENITAIQVITENEILSSNLILNYKEDLNVSDKWQLKNDYYEEEINKVYKENKFIKESFDYYLGLGELSISILNYINYNNIMYYMQHDRLNVDETLVEFYNPINIVIDNRVRDIALYIKSNFFENSISLDKIKKIINLVNLNSDEAIFLIARLVYPDYYYDICDSIINENYNSYKLINCIKKSSTYEELIKDIYNYLYKIYNLPKIEFLFK